MNTSIKSILTHRIAKALLLVLAVSGACTFLSACGAPYRHEARVENRVDRRVDRREDRHDRWSY